MNKQNTKNQISIDWLVVIFTFIATLILFLPFAQIDIDTYHDSIMLKPVIDQYYGQKLYLETFSQYSPLTNFIFLLFAKIFTPSFLMMKTVTVFFYALSISILIATWRLFLPRSLALISFLIWLIFPPFYERDWALLPWPSVITLPFQALSLFFIVGEFKRLKTFNYFLSGIFVGATFWCRQSVGFTLFLALLFSLILMWYKSIRGVRLRTIITFLFGFSSLSLVIVSYLQINGSLADWYLQNIVFVTSWTILNSKTSLVQQHLAIWFRDWRHGLLVFLLIFSTVLPAFSKFKKNTKQGMAIGISIFIFIFLNFHHGLGAIFLGKFRTGFQSLIPFVAFATFVYFLKKSIFNKNESSNTYLAVLTFSAVSIASILQYFPAPDYRHVYWGITPVFGLLTLTFWRITKYDPKLTTLILGLIFFPLLLQRAGEAKTKLLEPRELINQPFALNGMKVKQTETIPLKKYSGAVDEAMKSSKTKTILAYSPNSFFLLFAENFSNPGPFFVNWGYLPQDVEREQERRKQFITENRPLVVFTDTKTETVIEFEKKWNYRLTLDLPAYSLKLLAPIETN